MTEPHNYLPTGVYFGFDEAEYHKLPYLSASGIKQLYRGANYFWQSSWMNRNKRDERTYDMTLGNAYHARLLEGDKAMTDRFYEPLDTSGIDSLIKTSDDVSKALKERGLPHSFKTKEDGIQRLLEVCPDLPVLDRITATHAQKNEGKDLLKAGDMARIRMAGHMIERNPRLTPKPFTNGAPEVTVIWEAGGLRLKARMDYVSVHGQTLNMEDLKSFTHKSKGPLEDGVYAAMRYERYGVQAAHYYFAADEIIKFCKQGKVFGKGAADPLVVALAKCSDTLFRFLFIEKNLDIPAIVPKTFPRRTAMFDECAEIMTRQVIKFKKCMSLFGDDTPWMELLQWTAFDDAKMPIRIDYLDDPQMEQE